MIESMYTLVFFLGGGLIPAQFFMEPHMTQGRFMEGRYSTIWINSYWLMISFQSQPDQRVKVPYSEEPTCLQIHRIFTIIIVISALDHPIY